MQSKYITGEAKNQNLLGSAIQSRLLFSMFGATLKGGPKITFVKLRFQAWSPGAGRRRNALRRCREARKLDWGTRSKCREAAKKTGTSIIIIMC
jgi:hypothetical protein